MRDQIILGIDPGPESCGVVAYDGARVLGALSAYGTEALLLDLQAAQKGPLGLDRYAHSWPCVLVAIERVQSYGIAGASLLRTAETVGRLWQQACGAGCRVRLVYRRDVLRALDVTGKGTRDTAVIQRLLEMHGGDKARAVGRKAAPGPLYGCTGHAWQALGVAVAAGLGAGETPGVEVTTVDDSRRQIGDE